METIRTRQLEAENAALRKAVLDYLSECDNPVPDLVYRRSLRDKLRPLVGAQPNPVDAFDPRGARIR